MMNKAYSPPLALTIVSCVFLALGAICFLVVTGDIVWRKGWRSMMAVMVPVYPINAAYMLPLTLWVYFKYGRPKALLTRTKSARNHKHDENQEHEAYLAPGTTAKQADHHTDASQERAFSASCSTEKAASSEAHACHHHESSQRPMWVTLVVGVSHCGAGCVLGDIVGEWLVYGTSASINGRMIWVELLVDYAFALLFGIVFQYLSIAPMSGEWGLRTVWRAAKADILSLTSFEIGALGWMIVYQVAIFDYRLSVTTWLYWWMMQVGMVLGFATALPMNYFLIKYKIKEPCC